MQYFNEVFSQLIPLVANGEVPPLVLSLFDRELFDCISRLGDALSSRRRDIQQHHRSMAPSPLGHHMTR